MTQANEKTLLTSKELMKVLKVSKTSLTTYNNEGLPKITLGRTNRYVLEDVLEWFDKRKK